MTEEPKYPIKTTYRVLEMLEAIRSNDEPTLTEITADVELSKSAVYNHLVTLVSEDYVINDGDEYHLSLRFLDLGVDVQRDFDLYPVARRELKELGEKIDKQVTLAVEQNGRGVVLYQTNAWNPINSGLRPGSTFPLHCTAMGKAILAFLNDETMGDILDEHGLTRYTERTIVDRETLVDELIEIRDQDHEESHFATSQRERVRGLNSIAVPLLAASDDHDTYQYSVDNHVIQASLGVHLNNNEFQREQRVTELREELDRYKDNMSVNLSYS